MDHDQSSSDELLIRFSTAAGEVEKITGERPHVSSLHRWASRGLKGVTLQVQYAGGHRRTKRRWLREFFQAVTDAANVANGGNGSCEGHSDEIAEANAELEAAGI
jgi:hypothetical protein